MDFFPKYLPTTLFTIFELSNQSHDVPELPKICRSMDLKALELSKGSLGYGEAGLDNLDYFAYVHNGRNAELPVILQYCLIGTD